MEENFSSISSGHSGKLADKWSSYLPIYDRVLSKYKRAPISLLEIGVQNGGSLEIWSKYFESAQKIVGCDIDENCRKLSFSDKRIGVVVGSINSDSTLEEIKKISDEYDIIVDDGSHRSEDVITSFVKLFPLLKSDGIYIVEDMHTSYWPSYGGNLRGKNSSMEFFKSLVDVVNFEHWEGNKSATRYVQNYAPEMNDKLSFENLAQIHQVSFFNSICIVEKKTSDKNTLGLRNILGSEEPVTFNAIPLAGQRMTDSERGRAPSVKYRIRARVSRFLGRS
jgi:hypothetical protein